MTARTLTAVLAGGIAAGTTINICEWGAHHWWLDADWRAAFAALGREPRGWTTFIPANFWLGILAVLAYRWMAAREGQSGRTVALTALAAWAIFWVIPMLSLQPLGLFPTRLLALTIGVGALDASLGTWIGVSVSNWVQGRRQQ